MEFLVLSRSRAGRESPNEPYIVVSITNPELPEAILAESPHRRAVLRLRFHDTGDYGQPLRNDIVMTPSDARAILQFVRAHRAETRVIVCHCEAGVSRSAGVAAALSRLLNGDDRHFFADFAPNRWVYRTLLDAAETDPLASNESLPPPK